MKATLAIAPCFQGKTVLHKLQDEHSLKLVPDETKSVCGSHGFQTLYDMPEALQRQIRWQMLEGHLETLQETDILTEFNCFAWLADWMRWGWNSVPTEEWERVTDRARQCVKQYDQVFVATELPYREYDGYSWLDKRNGAQVTELIGFLLRHLEAEEKVIRLSTAS